MPYVGRQPDGGDFKVLTLAESFNGVLTDFTLSESVGTPNQLIVILSGVVQHWTDAFSVSGTTLTFSSAPASGETIKILKLGSVLSPNVPATETVVAGSFSKTGISANYVHKVNSAGNAWELGLLEGSDITTEGSFFSNWNTVTSNLTSTLTTSKNRMIIGPITVNDTYTWDVAGSGELTII